MLKKSTSFLLIVLMLLGVLLGLTGCGSNSKQENNVENIEETSWTSPKLEDENYLYYTYENEISKIRKDNLEYDTIYDSSSFNVDSIKNRNITIYDNNLYLTEYYKSSSEYNFKIIKIDSNGVKEPETLIEKNSSNEIHYTVTSKAIYYTLDEKMYKYNIEENTEKTFAESKFLPPSIFNVNDDESIYYVIDSKLYRMSENNVEELFKGSGLRESNELIKRGNNIYCSGSYLNNNNLQYIDLNEKSVKEVQSDLKGKVFNYGNSVFLLSTNQNLYKLKNNAWEEHSKLSNIEYNYINGVDFQLTYINMTEDAIIMQSMTGKSKAQIYNFKDNFYYGTIDEKYATKDTYLLNKMASTEFLTLRNVVSKNGTFVYTLDNENNIISGEIGDSVVYNKKDLGVFCSVDEMTTAINNSKIIKVSSVDVFNGCCYWCASTSNEIYLLKKECSGEKDIEIVSKIEGTTLNTTQYNENTMFIITANSVYKYDYTKSKELQLLYECKLRKYT